jgi:hypothetical protein
MVFWAFARRCSWPVIALISIGSIVITQLF